MQKLLSVSISDFMMKHLLKTWSCHFQLDIIYNLQYQHAGYNLAEGHLTQKHQTITQTLKLNTD